MRSSILLNVILAISCFSSANAEVHITEIMTNNVSTIISEKYNYDGYVEFFNDGSSLDLKGWTVTNTKEGKTNWSVKLDSTHVLPNGYSILFFGKSETSSKTASRFQYNYIGRVGQKLTTDEGSISFEKDGQKIKLDYPAQYPHISYCKDGYMIPSPAKENNRLVTDIANRVGPVSFKSGKPGIYQNGLNVELKCETEGAKIYYTKNGDIPTPDKGTQYNGSIWIDKSTSLRARAYKDGMLFSEVLTGSYFLPDKYHDQCKNYDSKPLPIVSITANNDDIFGDMKGIYVVGNNGIQGCEQVANYNQDWVRSANFEYYVNGELLDNQEVEIAVYGGCTRYYVGKSLKIKANKRSGKNKMQYNAFFADRSYKKYKSLALRNGGNGYAYVQPRWRDMFIQSLADGMNLDKQAGQPVSFYLNGEYYGMMILTERTDEDYVYHNYGLDEDEIDLIKGTGDYVCEIGTIDAYKQMINYVSNKYADEDFYDVLNTHMDIDEFINYQILEQYVGNKDWITNNIKLWRKHDGGRFRWIAYDLDFGLSPKSTSLDINMLDFATKPIKTSFTPALILMQSCMKNEDFRWRFLDQYIDILENQFTDERINSNIDSLLDLTDHEMCSTIKHSDLLDCPGSVDAYHNDIETMRSFAKERKSYVINQLKQEYGLGNDYVSVKIRAVFPNDENPDFKFLLNKREFNGSKYNTSRYSNERIKIEPEVPYGYKLVRWELNNELVRNDNGNKYLEEQFTTTAKSGEVKISMYFDYDPDCVLPKDLHLNEICASNQSTLDENGETSDWIEVYNGGDTDVDLAGMTIENKSKNVKYTFPKGHTSTIVPAHGYKLLWADKNTDLGPLHLDFKLTATLSDTIILSRYYRSNDVELSRITYNPHNPDESFGRNSDGASTIVLFAKCTDDNGNDLITSTPLSKNGSVKCPNTDIDETFANNHKTLVFAEGKNIYVQNAKDANIRVYTILGNVIADKKADSNMFNITMPVSGIYIVKLNSECWKVVVE